RKRADQAHDEAIKEAKKVRDAIVNVAQAVFTESWAQRDIEAKDAGDRLKERSDLAQKTYREAKDRAAATHKEAKNQAVDKQAGEAADKARKEAERQAKQAYDETMKK
ncbi:MAG: hypothetical protein JXA58_06290, partial [Dehalococcoidia bacterium]|nr:hypothetical protein [Dehalococcoidia bacterium]